MSKILTFLIIITTPVAYGDLLIPDNVLTDEGLAPIVQPSDVTGAY